MDLIINVITENNLHFPLGFTWLLLFLGAFWDMRPEPPQPFDWRATVGLLHRNNWEGTRNMGEHAIWSDFWLRQKLAVVELNVGIRSWEDCV